MTDEKKPRGRPKKLVQEIQEPKKPGRPKKLTIAEKEERADQAPTPAKRKGRAKNENYLPLS